MTTVVVYVKTPGTVQRISACAAEAPLPQQVKVVDCVPALFLELSVRPVDVVLVDVALAAPDPLKFTRTIRTRFPATGLVFTGAANPRAAAMMAAAGVLGFLRSKPGDSDDLLVAFAQTVLLARRQLTATTPLPRQRRARTELSDRELQILTGLTEGKRNAEIADDLFLSADTVKTHARGLYRKLGARDRAHAVAIAFRTGLVS